MTTPEPLVLSFAEIEPDTVALVGGKAANLGVLTRAGLPVPPGRCLTTAAYRSAVGGALDGVLDELDATDPGDTAALRALAQRARELVLAVPVPDDVAAAVRDGSETPVAVRSSATAEDLPGASFAGQQDTYLNVIGADAVLDAVRNCWASLWTDRAVAYRAANGVDHRSVLLAVVIQDMVQAELAGVMFTANPVTGTRRQSVIDAAPGLGESVVSGAVNPDHFVVDTDTGRIIERRTGDKLHAVRSLPGGGTETVAAAADTSGTAADAPAITDDRVAELARLGDRVERHYGAPQDTEWAIDAEGALWLTQSRPITTLYPVPVRRTHADGARAFLNINLAQGMFRPFTPMGASAVRVATGGVARMIGLPVPDLRDGAPALAEGGGRLFIDATTPLRSTVGRAIALRLLGVMEARSAVVVRALADDPRFSLTRTSALPFLRRAVPFALRNGLPLRAAAAAVSPAWANRDARRFAAGLRAQAAATAAKPVERLDRAEELLGTTFGPTAVRLLPLGLAGAAALGLASLLLRGHARPGEIATVLRGLPDNVTTEMDLALWHLAQRVAADDDAAALLRGTPPADLAERFHKDALPEPLAGGLAGFLTEYGHRTVGEIDLGRPRWAEDPTHIIGVLANYLRLDDPGLAPDTLFARGAAEAEAMIEELSGRVSGARAGAARFALGRARALLGIRELPKYCFVVVLAAARTHLTAVGADLAGRGLLEHPDDVFFVDLAEARSGLDGTDLRARVAERKDAYNRELGRRHLPRIVLSDGTEPEAVATGALPEGGGLTGTPASSGTATGTARVVLDPVGAHLEPGEILVCPSTDPGWTPLFLTAGGLVMEMGGANSHGAVVAREYGIPAVVGVAHATGRVESGDEVTVDGTSGAVSVAADAEHRDDPAPVR
ncbi:pyruvate,water dikinase [Murinocardiopsis flavida]|uniref:Pyruvate,water dikinase n=1 Tax=Murinocardiopsis flavida TaxID=645275 RepID=A0A2P8DGE0_9ACTN|nr:PEP/pyruvate-binding domain-containing protein [Murinocardiopsis flavida]PSK96259.1 pyruvate,water dikinase [Murinocardiopsis flavida]